MRPRLRIDFSSSCFFPGWHFRVWTARDPVTQRHWLPRRYASGLVRVAPACGLPRRPPLGTLLPVSVWFMWHYSRRKQEELAGWPNGKALDYESRDCRFDPCVGHSFFVFFFCILHVVCYLLV